MVARTRSAGLMVLASVAVGGLSFGVAFAQGESVPVWPSPFAVLEAESAVKAPGDLVASDRDGWSAGARASAPSGLPRAPAITRVDSPAESTPKPTQAEGTPPVEAAPALVPPPVLALPAWPATVPVTPPPPVTARVTPPPVLALPAWPTGMPTTRPAAVDVATTLVAPPALAAPAWPPGETKPIAPPADAVIRTGSAVPPPAPPPAPLPIEQTRGLVATLLDGRAVAGPKLPRPTRAALAAFYAARGFEPVWMTPEGITPAARGVLARLAKAEQDGLDVDAYAVAVPATSTSPEALAEFEVTLSAAAVAYARDARGARIDASRLNPLIDLKLDLPEPAEVLGGLIAAPDADAALAAHNPPHEGYRRLAERLAALRKAAAEPRFPPLPPGPVIKVGASDPRVPLLRERFQIQPLASVVYDDEVSRAVAGFQRMRGLPATGALTRATVTALEEQSGHRLVGDVIANMERWRWLPRDLGERHVIVNVPEFLVRVMERGAPIHQARVIVGKPETPTPIFSDMMQFLVVNPSWFVPPSILKKDFLPKLAADPNYAARLGYEVIRRGGSITVRQPPGERNALGHIKFMFPNRHSVYLHDTPSRGLFGSDRRAYSHGCVRVDLPFKLAEVVLGGQEGWTEARMRALVGSGERSVRLERRLPIHITYFTHFVDERGELVARDDLYGYHARVRQALGLDGTREAATRRPSGG